MPALPNAGIIYSGSIRHHTGSHHTIQNQKEKSLWLDSPIFKVLIVSGTGDLSMGTIKLLLSAAKATQASTMYIVLYATFGRQSMR